MPPILITGTAGFIGFHLARRLLDDGHAVFGLDNFNDYYSVQLKRDRHAQLETHPNYRWLKADLADGPVLQQVFADFKPDCVVNLAAQPGVRYSITNPQAYQKSNIEGFLNILECCRHATGKPRLIYASSSSVYGGNTELPFSEDQRVDTPVSLYAATKKANELMAHCYSHLYGMQTVGLRFFTVYGPWGRPDMAYWLFADAMLKGRPFQVFNHGNMSRDFTYVDDIVSGICGCICSDTLARYELFNIGNHRSEKLMDLIALIARELGIANPKMEFLPMQDGDVLATYANVDKLHAAVGYAPTTPISVGIPKFVKWFKEYGKLNTESRKQKVEM
jgi:UDP-glucuronate 4-epimerase